MFVQALLEITRIKLKQQVETDNFSLRKTIENAINFVEGMAKDKGIMISAKIAPSVDMLAGEEIYIEETIANLLANAVKYTPRSDA